MDYKFGVRFSTWIRIFSVRYIVQTGVAVHQTLYAVSRVPFLPGWGGSVDCASDLNSN
jgi:hypothetical protein